VYDQHVKQISQQVQSIHGRLEHLQQLEESIEINIKLVKNAKEERSAELQAALQEMDSRYTLHFPAVATHI
jgi:prefoldin subunit 5